MKMYLLCDNKDTLNGMRLAGVDGVVVKSASEFRTELEKVTQDMEIAILLINEKLCDSDREYVNTIKLKYSQPLIVEIPDRNGTGRSENFITAYVKDAIGVSL